MRSGTNGGPLVDQLSLTRCFLFMSISFSRCVIPVSDAILRFVLERILAPILSAALPLTTSAFISTGFKLACSLLSLVAHEITVP